MHSCRSWGPDSPEARALSSAGLFLALLSISLYLLLSASTLGHTLPQAEICIKHIINITRTLILSFCSVSAAP